METPEEFCRRNKTRLVISQTGGMPTDTDEMRRRVELGELRSVLWDLLDFIEKGRLK